jgi:uncharacterized membrane protein
MNWNRWHKIRSYSRGSLWIVPVFALLLQQVAIRLTDRLDPLLGWSFYGVGVSGAQATFNVISTMAISFLVFAFGSMLVAIQVAGGQLTPRIIATTLLRNNVVRYSVCLFVFTSIYAVGGLSRTEDGVNQLSFMVASAFGLGSVICFLYLIDYTARLLRPSSIMAFVGEQGLKVIDSVYARRHSERRQEHLQLPGRPHQVVFHTGTSGIVFAVNLEQLTAIARQADCVIELVAYVGDFVGVGEPLFHIHGGEVFDEKRLRAAVALGSERTIEQDPMFAFRILVDIGIKALSKAINDPTTAVLAIDQLHRLLRMVGRRHTRNDQVRDEAGGLRVVWRTPNWEDFVNLAIAEIRYYGAENIQVARRLRAMINNLIQTLPDSRHPALRRELSLLDRSIDKL